LLKFGIGEYQVPVDLSTPENGKPESETTGRVCTDYLKSTLIAGEFTDQITHNHHTLIIAYHL
jgi:hypothetical protein